MDLTVTDVPERNRYEATHAGRVVGVMEYHRKSGLIFMDHVETEVPMRGRGIAAQIVLAAMQAAREAGDQVVPRCPYVGDWLEDHPEWQDLARPVA